MHFYSVGVLTSTIGNEWSVPQAASQVIVASNHAAVLSHGDLNMLMDDLASLDLINNSFYSLHC